ncbi:helix-turn-helix transcriptional regulator [Enterococcus nangangensis]|uniref:helix-turn-helix transcriptional regulator n=1 Tax=Enterococcus nangangensis TaxID=2559926 RepID=UPI0010F92D6D|nr:helix-turn-helix transcriptional regulator [Enterococcus nangangensis]
MTKKDALVLHNTMKLSRLQKNLSQTQLAEIVGVSRQTISNIENEEFYPSAKLSFLLCLALDKKFEELFYFD